MRFQAFFDESEREGGTFVVAGLAFGSDAANQCAQEWKAIFGAYGGCHMRELSHRTGRFKGVSSSETGELLRKGVASINEHASFLVAVSCNVHEMSSLLPYWIRGFEGAYPVCCHMAMTMLGEVAGASSAIDYVFEEGHQHQAQAAAFMARVADVPQLKSAYQHHGHQFCSKRDGVLAETADLLAWEWGKYWDETAITQKRKMRKSLISLVTGGSMDAQTYDTKRVKVTHLTGEPLQRFCEQVSRLGLLQIAEDAAASSD